MSCDCSSCSARRKSETRFHVTIGFFAGSLFTSLVFVIFAFIRQE